MIINEQNVVQINIHVLIVSFIWFILRQKEVEQW